MMTSETMLLKRTVVTFTAVSFFLKLFLFLIYYSKIFQFFNLFFSSILTKKLILFGIKFLGKYNAIFIELALVS